MQHLLADGVTTTTTAAAAVVLPSQARIYAMAVSLKDLWKIRAPVGQTQGVDLLPFDRLMDVG